MDPIIQSFLENLILALIAAFVPILALAFRTWIMAKIDEAKRSYPTEIDILEDIVSIAVKAAEASKMSGLISDKKAYALNLAEQWLKDKGLNFDLEKISAAIEAEVLDQFNRPKLDPGEPQ